jgi:hypothetical protein
MNLFKHYGPVGIGLAAALAVSVPAIADSGDGPQNRQYEVRVTNITRGQQFTPLLTVVHTTRLSLFSLGAPASTALATLAEQGDTSPLTTVLSASPDVASVATQDGLLGAGQMRTFLVSASGRFDSLTVAAMLIPTNDAFLSVTFADLPLNGQTVVRHGIAYDAGSERNDELCSSIPGPFFSECGGPGGGARVGGGEGFVHVHAGIHGIADLKASQRDWRNPIVSVSVRRIH